MRGIAANWRRVYTQKHEVTWRAVADLLDKYADEAERTIAEVKRSIPKTARRVRLKDN